MDWLAVVRTRSMLWWGWIYMFLPFLLGLIAKIVPLHYIKCLWDLLTIWKFFFVSIQQTLKKGQTSLKINETNTLICNYIYFQPFHNRNGSHRESTSFELLKPTFAPDHPAGLNNQDRWVIDGSIRCNHTIANIDVINQNQL